MSNHVHGIIVINAPVISEGIVETQHAASLRSDGCNQPIKQTTQESSPKVGSISTIMRSYKSAVSHWAGKNGYAEFSWQSRFFDRIIRDERSLNTVRAYIIENLHHWDRDDYYAPSVTI